MKRKSGLSPLFWFGVGYLVLLVIFAIVGPNLRHPFDVKVGGPFLYPSDQFWFGTDEQGRDIFARLAYGARTSLVIGLVVQSIAVTVGLIVGVASIYAPKWISIPIQRFVVHGMARDGPAGEKPNCHA
jgi:peptide/nickel transport system permease protein